MPIQQIDIQTRPEVTHVAGTVNGNPADFSYIGANTWRAIVPRSEDSTYHIYIIAYNENGSNSIEKTIHLGWIPGITDRIWENPGYRNAEDLNRIGTNMLELQRIMHECGIGITITPKDDWIFIDIPREYDINKILDEINELRRVFLVFPTTPDTPEIPITIYWKMNDIEQILEDLHLLLRKMMRAWFFTGEIYSGEV